MGATQEGEAPTCIPKNILPQHVNILLAVVSYYSGKAEETEQPFPEEIINQSLNWQPRYESMTKCQLVKKMTALIFLFLRNDKILWGRNDLLLTTEVR
jgi:hypothetical protein